MIDIIKTIISPPHSKWRFLTKINKKGVLLDIGCGNNSSYNTKMICPDIYYIGIDVGDYNNTKPNMADKYILTTPEKFAETIVNISVCGGGGDIDTIISSHNLEHCNEREDVFNAILKVLKSGGNLFLSFPSEDSINFPHRYGTLNYYDDITHKYNPCDFNKIINTLKESNFDIIFSSCSYKPLLYFIIGFLVEPLSKALKRVLFWSYGTWAYWGFESIVWAKKK